jgi:hypothetical protein
MIGKILTGMALVALGALVVVAGSAANLFGFNLFQQSQVDRSQPVLLKSIQDVSRYNAAVGNLEVVLDVEDDVEGIPAFIAGRRTLYVAAGTVNAYVDLSGLADKDMQLSPDGKSVTVRLPAPELEKPNLDFDRSYTYDQERGIVDQIADAITPPQQEKLYQLAEKKMTTAAEASELRKQAAENTKAMLTGMLGSFGVQATFLDDASR